MSKRRHYIAFIIVFGLGLIALNLPPHTVSKVKLALAGVFLPLFGLAGSTQNAIDQSASHVLPRRDIIRQNTKLQQENEQLRIQLMQQEDILRENAELRQQLAWQKRIPWNLRFARVIARDPANWWRTVMIDLGTRDGITTNMAVLTTAGLVGRVSATSQSRSQVLLLGDRNLRVGAMVRETGDTGVVRSGSAGPLENNMVEMAYLPGNSQIKPGYTIVTSGDGGIFRKGILIGTVVDAQTIGYGMETMARIKLAANFDAVEYVWVLMP
jgi:rod shape-determining protein MreC